MSCDKQEIRHNRFHGNLSLKGLLRTVIPRLVFLSLLTLVLWGCRRQTPATAGSSSASASAESSVALSAQPSADVSTSDASAGNAATAQPSASIDENGTYTSRDEVALYLHTYGRLPSNFITKNKARDLGWDSSKGNLGKVAPGMSIGGDKFGNREGLLPEKKGRQYYECDIDYTGGSRGAKRIVYSDDGLIFYTDDHYESFTQLY